MHRIIGAIIFLVGLAVLLGARKIADHFGPEVQPMFRGAPTDRTVYVYVCGGVVALLGVIQLVWKRK